MDIKLINTYKMKKIKEDKLKKHKKGYVVKRIGKNKIKLIMILGSKIVKYDCFTNEHYIFSSFD